jgi:hypothetical protein
MTPTVRRCRRWTPSRCLDLCSYRHFRPHSIAYWRWFVCLLAIYLLNLLFGLQYYLWSERSFYSDYPLTMNRIDLNRIDRDHPEKVLGPSKYILPNEFLVKNEHRCDQQGTSDGQQCHIIILVKSAIDNVQARQAIRLTWANPTVLNKHSVRVAFVLGNVQTDERAKPMTWRPCLDCI